MFLFLGFSNKMEVILSNVDAKYIFFYYYDFVHITGHWLQMLPGKKTMKDLEGKYTEWPNPQIRGENRQSGLTD